MTEHVSGVVWAYEQRSITIFVNVVTSAGTDAVIEIRVGHQVEVTLHRRPIAAFSLEQLRTLLQLGTGGITAGPVTLALAGQISVSVTGVVDGWPLAAVEETRIRRHLLGEP